MLLSASPCNDPVTSGGTLCQLDLGGVGTDQARQLELVFEGFAKTTHSVVVRVSFASGDGMNVAVGELYTYGEGPHGAPDDARFRSMTLRLDATEAARHFAGFPNIRVRLEIFDHHGRELTKEAIHIRRLELHSLESD